MNHRPAGSANVCAVVFACLLCVAPFRSFAQQQLNLKPLPWVPPVPEYLMPGKGQGFAGLATFYNGVPVIFYDSVWVEKMGGLDSPGFRFVRAHEYAHHVRQHGLIRLNSPPQAWPFLGYQEELDADCVAVDYLKKVGDIDAIRAGFQIYQQVLPPQDSGGRPGAAIRVDNMNKCAG